MEPCSSSQRAPESVAAPDVRRPAVSVIIPTLDEADELPGTLESVRPALGEDIELIVVDGGSRDGTPERAARQARVIESSPGRGRQLAAGAEAANAQLLLFLHADTWLSPGTGASLRQVAAQPEVVGGCFEVSLRGPDAQRPLARMLARAINLRSRFFGTATGDQAIFVKRWAYDRAGGVPAEDLFEDVLLYRRIRRLGEVRVLKPAVRPSDRRWRTRGYSRTIGLHLLLRILFLLRVPPARLSSMYRRST
ncbi:MAG: TIGR04283 family arsenosugar biosynthesis glycosyltransferase [Gemmatimonadales bacterium]